MFGCSTAVAASVALQVAKVIKRKSMVAVVVVAVVVVLAWGGNLHLFEFGYLENRINRKHKP